MHAPKPPPGPLDASIFVEALRAHVGKFVACALILHALLWTLVPLLGEPTPDPKLAVGLAVGRHWLLGYPGLPPLAPWVLQIVYSLIPSVAVLKALGPLAVALAGWFVFAFARRIVGARHGALAVLIMVGVYPVAFPVSALDSNSIQMPLIAALTLTWWRAAVEGNREAWLCFGLIGALLFYAGAQGVVVLALLLLITAGTGAGRAAFREHRSLSAALAALILFATIATPRLWWLATHGFSGFTENTGAGFGLHGTMAAYEAFGSAILGYLGLILLIIVGTPLFVAGKTGVVAMTRAPLNGFGLLTVLLLALAPVLFCGALALALQWRTAPEVFAPLLLYSGLLVVVLAGNTIRLCRQHLASMVALILLVLPPMLMVSVDFALPWLGHFGLAANWPAEPAARAMTTIFRTRTGKPLAIVIGRPLLASEIALASADRPEVFPDGDPELAPWIAADALRAQGGVVFWPVTGGNAAPPAPLAARLPAFIPEAPLTLPWHRGGGLDPVTLGWGIIPPAKPAS